MDGLTHMADPVESFAAWLLEMLGGSPLANSGNKQWSVPFGGEDAGDEIVSLAAVGDSADQLAMLAKRVAARAPLSQAVARSDVQRVAEIAPSLYAPYDVPGGTVRLAGCQLENRYFVRRTFLQRGAKGPVVIHYWFWLNGEPVADELISQLGLHELAPPTRPLPEAPLVLPETLASWTPPAEANELEPLLDALVGVKWAAGKLEVIHSDPTPATVSIEFSGWATAFRDGHVSPPAFVCPATGVRGYRFVRTADGELTVEEATGVCELTGKRYLIRDMATCVVSGVRTAKSEMVVCPVSHDWLLPQELVVCEMCRQEVSPLVIAGHRCRACRRLEHVSADDPRIVRLTEAHPEWKTRKRWQLSETDRVYIAVADAWWQRWLIVTDKDSLETLRLAKRSPLRRRWRDEVTRSPELTSRAPAPTDHTSS